MPGAAATGELPTRPAVSYYPSRTASWEFYCFLTKPCPSLKASFSTHVKSTSFMRTICPNSLHEDRESNPRRK